MLLGPDVASLALEMKAAQDAAYQIDPFSQRVRAFDLSTAYEVAHHVHRLRLAEGAETIGRKLGFTNADMWVKYGVREPVWAYLYDKTVTHLATPSATCSLAGFVEPKIEPEIVFRFGSTPQPGSSLTELLRSIEWVAHGFEIVQSHFPNWVFEAPDTVADRALHATLLIGPPSPIRQLGADPLSALEAFTVSMSCDGRFAESGKGCNVLGSPVAAVAHLLSVLRNQPTYPALQSGEIVTTGTITTALRVTSAQVWQSQIQGIPLPGLTVRFTA